MVLYGQSSKHSLLNSYLNLLSFEQSSMHLPLFLINLLNLSGHFSVKVQLYSEIQ